MALNQQIERNVEEIEGVERRERERMTWSDHVADLMTAFSGSMLFVLLHGIWFGGWIMLGQGWFGLPTLDESYSLLTMIVSLEAIFLSTFVLISENRQARQADRRAKVDLQFNIMAEQEVTKLIKMIDEIRSHLGIAEEADPALQEMQQPTRVEAVADAIEARDEKLRATAR
jgi:uncharacterized membrane protein